MLGGADANAIDALDVGTMQAVVAIQERDQGAAGAGRGRRGFRQALTATQPLPDRPLRSLRLRQHHQHGAVDVGDHRRSEEHTSELQSLMRISYAVFCLKKKNNSTQKTDRILYYIHTQ